MKNKSLLILPLMFFSVACNSPVKNAKFLQAKIGLIENQNNDYSIDNYMLNTMKKYKNNTDVEIIRTQILTDFADNNFKLFEFNEGYGVYSYKLNDMLEMSPFGISPYAKIDFDKYDLKYLFNVGYYTISKADNKIFDILNNCAINEKSEIKNLQNISRNVDMNFHYNLKNFDKMEKEINPSIKTIDDKKHDPDKGLIDADVECKNSWYFKVNKSKMPNNTDGICGYTALSSLIGYHEIFSSAGYLSDEESNLYMPKIQNGYCFDVPKIADSFPYYAFGNDIGSSDPFKVKDAMDRFMKNKNKKYEHYCYVSVFSTITDPIKDGVPAIYFGNHESPEQNDNSRANHAIIVYGYYNDGKLLCHWGWNASGDNPGYSQVIINKLGLFQEGGVYAIYNKSEHIHKGYFDYGDYSICGCGKEISNE